MLLIYLILIFIVSKAILLDYFLIKHLNITLTTPYKVVKNILIGALMFLSLYLTEYKESADNDYILPLAILIHLSSLYWFLFDLGLNISLGNPLFYNGNNSILDRFLKTASDKIELLIKVLFIIISTIVLWNLK